MTDTKQRSQWKDATSYQRGDKERIPTAYELKLTGLRIYITCAHIHHEPDWIMHCRVLNIDTRPLAANSLAGAKAEAIYEVKKLIEFFAAKLDKL